MTNIQNLIFNEIKRQIKLITGKSIDIDTDASSIHWEPNHDRFNGDVFRGTIYLKNDDVINYYDYTGILKSLNEFDIKKLQYIRMDAIVEQDLI